MLKHKNEQELKSILKKYLNKEANAEESRMVDLWYQQLGGAKVENPFATGVADKNEVLDDIQEYLRVHTMPVRRRMIHSNFFKYGIAAMLVLCIGLGWMFTKQKTTPQQEILISTLPGTHKEVKLTDGTMVFLNAKSQLRVAKDFGQKDRKVFLEGEAFFKVARNEKQPFLIQSGPLRTRVLGTSFNINAYPDKDRIKVVVSTGKVEVSKAGEVLAQGMTTNQSVSYYRNTGKYELKDEDAKLTDSWRDNKLYIDNASIPDIARQLELHYNIKVLCELKRPSNDKYTIRFNNESMSSVLKILSMLTKNKFIYNDHQILIQ